MKLITLYRKIITYLFFKSGTIVLIGKNSIYANQCGIIIGHPQWDDRLFVRIINSIYDTKLIHIEISVRPEWVIPYKYILLWY